MPDISPLSGLAATPIAGTADVKLTATGSANRPELALVLESTGLEGCILAVDHLAGNVAVTFDTALGGGPLGLRANGAASTEGLALDGRELADGRLALSIEGELPAKGDAIVRELSVRSSLGEISGHATIDRDRLAGTARLDARVPELKAVMLALDGGLPLAGTVAVGADVVIGEGAKRIEIALDGAANELSGLPPGARTGRVYAEPAGSGLRGARQRGHCSEARARSAPACASKVSRATASRAVGSGSSFASPFPSFPASSQALASLLPVRLSCAPG